MKKFCALLASLLMSLSSCGTSDSSIRYLYLASKYKLKYAAFNGDYVISDSPAYFFQIPDCTDCIDLFDKNSSFVTYNVRIENGNPIGFGTFDIVFADTTVEDTHLAFEYIGYYDGSYGGELKHTEDTKISYVGKQYCRGKYWYVRMECWFPQITDKRIVMEFETVESYADPQEFDHKIF